MACLGSTLISCDFRIYNCHGCNARRHNMTGSSRLRVVGMGHYLHGLSPDLLTVHQLSRGGVPIKKLPSRSMFLVCGSVLVPGEGSVAPLLKSASVTFSRFCNTLQQSPIVLQLIPAVGVIAFAAWGLAPVLRLGRILFLHRTDSSWNKSRSHYVMASYLQPLLLWTGAIFICRALDPVVLPSEVSQAVKQRLLNFVRSLSTVLAFAYCLSSLIRQVQKFLKETNESSDGRNMGFDFAGKAIYSAVWVAAVSLFMELLGFSTQKWLTAGGLGTVLLTLAGREIFTNFLSSVMIHATRPFVLNEWIQTKIEGYEVSGTVEHVGWWSPTIIRGDDREAVHIPNHKFTVNVVRNLTQKSHWRVKTHIAISHLDVNKINSIIADMRKLLAKNPQVEQQRLHRRVFLENINPENQALMILISCFVKTSHFEEYLCVKEAILLDLLRVVSHHKARLATPIRTIQEVYGEAALESVPFSDTIFTRDRGATNRPLLLVEPAYTINGEDEVKASTLSEQKNGEKDAKLDEALTSESNSETKAGSVRGADPNKDDRVAGSKPSTHSSSSTANLKSSSGVQAQDMGPDNSVSRSVQPKNDSIGDAESVGAASTGAESRRKLQENSPVVSLEPGKGEIPSASPQAKQDDDKSPSPLTSPSIFRPSLEDNLVLGVALEGSKRTLPIDDEINPSPVPAESREFAGQQNGSGLPSGKDNNNGHTPNPSMKKND